MFSEFISMTFSVDIFTIFNYVSMYLFVYLYICASNDEEHQWYYFRMDLLCSYLYLCIYVCMYVCLYEVYFLQFMVINIILTRVFFISCAYREKISYLQHEKGMWPRLRGYCPRGPTLLTIGSG